MPLGTLLLFLHVTDYTHVCVREMGSMKSTYNYLGGGSASKMISRYCDRIIVKTEIFDDVLIIYVSPR